MSITLTLPPDVANRLAIEAARRDESVDRLAIRLISNGLPMSEKAQSAINLLNSWEAEDEALSEDDFARHREVLKAIDDDRPAERKLFERITVEKSM